VPSNSRRNIHGIGRNRIESDILAAVLEQHNYNNYKQDPFRIKKINFTHIPSPLGIVVVMIGIISV
jgi:hypothetical protein